MGLTSSIKVSVKGERRYGRIDSNSLSLGGMIF